MDLLSNIANPMIADVGGRFREGQERGRANLSREMVGEIVGSTFGGRLGALGEINPDAAMGLGKVLGIPANELQRQQAFFGNNQAFNAILNGSGPEDAGEFLKEIIANTKATTGQGTERYEAQLELLQRDPEQARQGSNALVKSAIEAGYLQAPQGNADTSDIRKELRAGLRNNFDSIIKEESAITTNYKKIQGLLGEVGKGNRTAVAQSIVSLVKLGDPGSTVSGQEMVAALNNQDPTGAFTNLILSTGASEEVKQAILNSFDPLNPNTFSVDNFQATADRVLESQVGSIQSRFNDFSTQGRSNLSQQGLDSVLPKGLQSRIDKLSDLMVKRENSAPPAPIASQIETLTARREALLAEIAAMEAGK